jgi:lipopolysaccharide export LptBFGC system permease protein LptF
MRGAVRILSHYFIARFVGLFTTVLAATVLLVATLELVLHLDDVSGLSLDSSSSSPGPPDELAFGSSALRFLWVRLAAYYLTDLLPVSAFLAAFIAVAWAGRALELVALEAGGIRVGRILTPILASALILSCVTAVLHETLVLPAQRIWSASERDADESIDFGRRAFWYHKGPIITNVAKADRATRTLSDVEIYERDENHRIVRVIEAPRVRIDDAGRWQIEDARVWTFAPNAPASPPGLEEHVTMGLDIEAMGGDALLGAEPGLLPIADFIRYLEADIAERPSDRRRLLARYHERLSQPWLLLTFVWLALPFALLVDERGRIGRPAVAAVAALGLFFLLRSAGMTLAQQEIIPVGVTPWAVMAFFSAASAIALWRRAI